MATTMNTKLEWKITDYRDGPAATAAWNGLWLWVGNMEGRWTVWTINRGPTGAQVAEGRVEGDDHFNRAMRAAEEALRDMVKARLEQLRRERSAQRPEEDILQRISAKYGVTREEILDRRGPRSAPEARHEAMSEIRGRLGWTHVDIGRLFDVGAEGVRQAIRRWKER